MTDKIKKIIDELAGALRNMLDKAYKQDWNDHYPDQVGRAEAALERFAELDKPDEAAEHNADIACNMARKHIELKARADALADALAVLCADVRSVTADEPPERRVPAQHRVCDLRQAGRALVANRSGQPKEIKP